MIGTGKQIIILFITLFFVLCSSGCKKKKPGCMDATATNYDITAELSDGSCLYTWIIRDPSFEFFGGTYQTQGGNGFSTAAYPWNSPEGFMPTDGQYYWKCVPYIGHSTQTTQSDVLPNKHFKGIYFDYRYVAKTGSDSVLKADASLLYVGYQHTPVIYGQKLFLKTLPLSAASRI
jgi:hypothetical protein